MPWGADQFFNAGQLARIGAGRWMYRQRFTPASSARALDCLLHDKRYHERARAISSQIAREDGVAALCDAINDVLHAPIRLERDEDATEPPNNAR